MKKSILFLLPLCLLAQSYEFEPSEQPEIKVIKQHFQDRVDELEFAAWAKGMGLSFSTQTYLNRKTYQEYAKTMAELIRETRGVEGKVEVCYMGTPQKKIERCAKF